jgi:hypothetical protein
MAAREHELEPLVGEGRLLQLILHSVGHLEQLGLRGERLIAPDPVDRAVASGRDEPRAGVGGGTFARPPLCGDRERVLSGILGEVDVAEEPDQRSEDAAPLVAKGLLDQRSTTGRTSIAPPIRAVGTREASSIAASRSSASYR